MGPETRPSSTVVVVSLSHGLWALHREKHPETVLHESRVIKPSLGSPLDVFFKAGADPCFGDVILTLKSYAVLGNRVNKDHHPQNMPPLQFKAT